MEKRFQNVCVLKTWFFLFAYIKHIYNGRDKLI